MVQTTFKRREDAEKIGETLVRENIAACAHIHRCKSIYIWKGKLERQPEWVLELNMAGSKYARAERMIKKLHPYKLPQIIAFRAARASREYARWVGKSR